MGKRILLWFLWFVLVSGNADPAILPVSELTNFQQSRLPLDPRPRLSVSQQAQILSDVQQHQQRYLRPQNPQISKQQASYASLAKYKVDRTKQQQIQQLLQQQQQVQQLIQQQQQKLSQQLDPKFLPPNPQVQQFQQQHRNVFQNAGQDEPLFNNPPLQEYLEKQRELELLQKQRQQLLLEQQELRRQQELLRLQQLQKLTSTTQATIPTTGTVSTNNIAVSSIAISTPAPLLVSLPTARKITPSETDLFLKAIAVHQKKFTATSPVSVTTVSSTAATPSLPKSTVPLIPIQNLEAKPSKPQIKIIYQTEKPTKESGSRSDKDAILKQLKLALTQSVDDEVRNISARDIVLPNGRKIQLVNSPDDLALESSTTIKPAKAILDELTQGVLPPGADFELIRQKSDGKLEEVGKVGNIQNLPGKKVTFVVLEEQPDGSYKVQGVKGNVEKESQDVDSIVEKIKKGELKLPPSSGSTVAPAKVAPIRSSSRTSDYVTSAPNSVSTTDKYLSSASSVTSHVFNSLNTTPKNSQANKYTTRSHFIPTMAPVSEIITTIVPPTLTTYSHPSTSSYVHFSSKPEENLTTGRTSFGTVRPVTNSQDDNVIQQESFERLTTAYPSTAVVPTKVQESLTSLLKREGLYAMAKYLRQSGLDNVLNETGPYTIFVPTDKAFRTLLVQLGGPEKAEQKFKDNPRLLSGLLLHHVIPGAFRIDSLQDEMTGVSLAGTQLRVNEYSMHDHEWNDIKVTTINGARVAPNKRDIEIPQGIAHSIDRVMFPLPVGDLVQTLQSDRERRFTTFLKLLYVSGLQDTLSGPKTFTVFAPTDSAFEAAISKDGQPIWTEEEGPDAAKTIVSRHILPSTLYTAGMRYYLQKDTLRPQSPIHIHKNVGRVKVNEINVITQNVPATNGVLHAIEGVL